MNVTQLGIGVATVAGAAAAMTTLARVGGEQPKSSINSVAVLAGSVGAAGAGAGGFERMIRAVPGNHAAVGAGLALGILTGIGIGAVAGQALLNNR